MAPAKAAAPHRAALRLAVHAVLLSFDFLDSARHSSSSQRVKFVNGEVRLSEQLLEEPDPEFRVLRNRKGVGIGWPDHHHMGACLAGDRPTRPPEFLNRFGPRAEPKATQTATS